MKSIVISRKSFFSAAVNSKHSSGGEGHNFVMECYVEGPIDERTGLVINLMDLESVLSIVRAKLDHKHLNKDLDWFKDRAATCELVAEYCFSEMDRELAARPEVFAKVKLVKVKVSNGLEESGSIEI